MVVICKQIYETDACNESYDEFMGIDISVDEHKNSIDCECAKDQIADADPDDFSSCFHSRIYLLSSSVVFQFAVLCQIVNKENDAAQQ